jgi:hypothetical protein
VDQLTFWDDQSTDSTRSLISACPKAILNDWPGEHGIVDDQFLDFANEQWKSARGNAHWVIWVDTDEFLYHPNILNVLEQYLNDGVDLPEIQGYTMVSDHFPTTSGQIYDEIKTGFQDDIWSKAVIFRGNMIWNVGRHSVNYDAFTPSKKSGRMDLKLLHYRALGWDYLEWRHRRNWERVPERCRQKNFGTNCSPGWQGHHGLDWFREIMARKLPEVI